MLKSVAIILAISFAGIALFGFSAAANTVGGVHVGCVTDAFQGLQGKTCPVGANVFTFLSYHFGALKQFTGAVGAGLLAFIALLAFAALFERFHVPVPQFASVRAGRIICSPRTSHAKCIRWTALHETSPTFRA